jgi:hypothetical protein
VGEEEGEFVVDVFTIYVIVIKVIASNIIIFIVSLY